MYIVFYNDMSLSAAYFTLHAPGSGVPTDTTRAREGTSNHYTSITSIEYTVRME